MRGATTRHSARLSQTKFQSTLLMRGATITRLSIDEPRQDISIHAPHARSDPPLPAPQAQKALNFNPRSSCEERLCPSTLQTVPSDFNPRSSCEERRTRQTFSPFHSAISIHAPHARSDRCDRPGTADRADFNPRSSCEERPHCRPHGDTRGNYFNPRSSCEERPAGGKTLAAIDISIHAPHARSDASPPLAAAGGSNFNPRSSCEERHLISFLPCAAPYFNPRSSCEERLCHFQALICLTSSYIFREPLASFRKHFF